MGTAVLSLIVAATLSPAAADPLGRPENDSLAAATPITELPFEATASTQGATPDGLRYSGCGPNVVRDVWFRFDASKDTPLRIGPVTPNAAGDAWVIPWIETETGELAAFTDCGAGTDLTLRAGGTLFLQVASFGAEGAAVRFRAEEIAESSRVLPVPGDLVAEPVPIELPYSALVYANFATADAADPTDCIAGFSAGGVRAEVLGRPRTVWHRVQADQDARWLASTTGYFSSGRLGAYRQTLQGLEFLGCGDPLDDPSQDRRFLPIEAQAGETYLFQVTSVNPEQEIAFSLDPADVFDLGVSRVSVDVSDLFPDTIVRATISSSVAGFWPPFFTWRARACHDESGICTNLLADETGRTWSPGNEVALEGIWRTTGCTGAYTVIVDLAPRGYIEADDANDTGSTQVAFHLGGPVPTCTQ